jgi:hypothetical protein
MSEIFEQEFDIRERGGKVDQELEQIRKDSAEPAEEHDPDEAKVKAERDDESGSAS